MTNRDMPKDFRYLSRVQGTFVGLAAIVPYVFFSLRGHDGIARASAVSCGVLVGIAAMSWPFRRLKVLWLMLTVMALVHILLTVMVPWSDTRLPGAATVPFFFVDFILCLAVAYAVLIRPARKPATSTHSHNPLHEPGESIQKDPIHQ